MSVYLVEKNHVDYLIGAAIAYGWSLNCFGGANAAGLDLVRANEMSFNHRYPNDAQPLSDGYVWSACHSTFDPVQVIASCNCLAYQCDEHPAWERSHAKQLVDKIRRAAIAKLTENAIWGAPAPTVSKSNRS